MNLRNYSVRKFNSPGGYDTGSDQQEVLDLVRETEVNPRCSGGFIEA